MFRERNILLSNFYQIFLPPNGTDIPKNPFTELEFFPKNM